MDLGLDARVALVMGASRGIGRGIATVLAREGARVAISSRSRARLEEAAAGIDGEVACFEADTEDLDALPGLPRRVEAEMGAIEILVTNTGGPPPGGALEHPPQEWQRAHTSLLLAPRVLAEAVAPGMRERGWGRIVNVASTSVREPIPGLALSNAYRAAALGLFKTLSRELAADGVTVNTVGTGRFATERLVERGGSMDEVQRRAREDVPAARLGTPEEYGELVAFLCSDRAAYLTGALVALDGGLLRSS